MQIESVYLFFMSLDLNVNPACIYVIAEVSLLEERDSSPHRHHSGHRYVCV